MDTILLCNQNNQKFSANVIRYFKVANKNYLIFSLNEIDEQGYVKLYAVRIEEGITKNQSYNLTQEEWQELKDQFHIIVNNNRNGILNQGDLRTETISGILVTGYKPFKLKKETVKELSENKNYSDTIIMNNQLHDEYETITSEEDMIANQRIVSEINPTVTSGFGNVGLSSAVATSHAVPSIKVENSAENVINYEEKYNDMVKQNEILKSENMKIRQELEQLKDKINKAIGDLSQLNL